MGDSLRGKLGCEQVGGEMDYPQIMKDITAQQGFLFGTCFVLSPPIANFVKARFDTIEELDEWLAPPRPQFPGFGKPKPDSAEGDDAPAPKPKMPAFGRFSNATVIVTGASNNNYWSAGGLRYGRSIKIDEWR